MLLCILIKNCTVGHLFVNVGEKKKKKRKEKRLEHWVGNWEQLEWSPLGGWIPSSHIVPLEDESARGDRSKELKILRMRKEAT